MNCQGSLLCKDLSLTEDGVFPFFCQIYFTEFADETTWLSSVLWHFFAGEGL